ncbi:hypothetical protein HJFPF1_01430 [Paramyrothecium foliicola]|nr:hypothetical protein HJFPF1_01430 [Paramyrothecium foliicola]
MAPASSATASVAPTINSTRTETRPHSTAAGTTSTPMPGHSPSALARNQSKDATDTQASGSFNTAPDGRVRNPVPSKLKGMADKRNGNFGVMHMDLTKPETSARDAAAKRTSESTAAAAQRANKNGYQSVKRSQLAWRPSDSLPAQTPAPLPPQAPASTSSTPQTSAPYHPPSTGLESPAVPAQKQSENNSPAYPRPPGLPPHVTKSEQARLLTLLRSLHPVLVVDQLCKALAYFGGIPGAPPPANNKFPESVGANGSGALFVGWLAEIFPPVGGSNAGEGTFPSPPVIAATAATPGESVSTAEAANITNLAAPAEAPVKRSRGRPKGSKSSKVRKDKGIKKKIGNNTMNTASEAISLSNSRAVETNHSPAPIGQATSTFDAVKSNTSIQTPLQSKNPAIPDQQSSQAMSSTQNTVTPGSRKRGRPKGSKNRPKAAASDTPSGSGANVSLSAPESSQQNRSSPLTQKSGLAPPLAPGPSHGTAASALETPTTPRADNLPQPSSNLSPASFALVNAIGGQQEDNTNIGSIQPGSTFVTQGDSSYRKRKASQLPTAGEQNFRAATSTPISHDPYNPVEPSGKGTSPIQKAQAKRRRMSKEASQTRINTIVDAQTPATRLPPPSNPSNDFSSTVQSGPTTNHLEMQPPVDKLPAVRTTARFGPNYRLHRQQQQKSQSQLQHTHGTSDLSASHAKQQSPALGRGSQPAQTQQVAEPPGSVQARQQPPTFFPASQANRSPQTYYTQQRQPVTQYSHTGNGGGNFGLGLSNSQPVAHFPQALSKQDGSDSRMKDPAHQGAGGISRNKQAPESLRRPGYTNQQSPRSSSGPSPAMSQYGNYGDGGYLNMDYVMNNQDASNTTNAAVAAFGGGSPIEEAMGEPSIRNRIY